MSFYVQLLAIFCATSALACWCGWGLARLALPAALQPYRALLTPLLGYALAIVVGYWFVRTVSGLLPALVALLAGTGALNLLAWRRGGPPRLLKLLREEPALLALLAATLLVGIAPLLHYGHPAIIGGGWDIETALPTARYLERGPVAAIASAPDNPLRDLVRDPPRIGKTIGFAVWQGSLSMLTSIEEILTWPLLLAWLRTLGVLAVYVLLRATLGLRRGPALLGAAWTSAGALMLWISYFNFEKQMASWALIPLGLLLAVAAVEDLAARGWRAWPAAFTAAIGLTALPVAYYPALTLWAPLALGLAAAILVAAPNRLRLLGGALALLALTLVIGAPTILDYWLGFAFRYQEQLTNLGVLRYIPATDIVGLTPYLQGQGSTPATPWGLAALAALVALAVVGLILPAKDQGQTTTDQGVRAKTISIHSFSDMRLRWLGMAAGGLAYLAWLRYWQAYPYAYMKGAAYAGFVFVGLAAAGWQVIAARLAPRARLAAAAVPLLLSALMLTSQARIVRNHWEAPGLYPKDFPALLPLRQLIPAGSTVTLTDNLYTEGVTSGLAAYMLDRATVWGHVKTGYTSATTGAPDAIGEYALLPINEDPVPWGYDKLIWASGSYALYQRPPALRAHLRPEELLAPGQALAFSLGGEHLAQGVVSLPSGPARQVDLIVAALHDATVSLDGKSFALPAGLTRLRLAASTTGRSLELRNSGATPVLLRSISLADAAASGADAVEPLRAAVVASARAAASAQTVTATMDLLLPSGGPLTLAVDIWDGRRGQHYGWYGTTLATSAALQTATFGLDLRSGTVQARSGDGSAFQFTGQFEGLREGDYTAHMQISAGATLLAPPSRLFAFRVGRDGAISAIRTQSIQLVTATTDRPQYPLDARLGADVRLQGYAIDTTSPRAGDTLTLTLWWEALAASGDERSILLHVLNSQGAIVAQADGAPAHGTRPTSQWQAGEIVVDSHAITLPPDLPAGQYMLALGMYRWPSLERLALAIGQERQPDDIVRVPITIVR